MKPLSASEVGNRLYECALRGTNPRRVSEASEYRLSECALRGTHVLWVSESGVDIRSGLTWLKLWSAEGQWFLCSFPCRLFRCALGSIRSWSTNEVSGGFRSSFLRLTILKFNVSDDVFIRIVWLRKFFRCLESIRMMCNEKCLLIQRLW